MRNIYEKYGSTFTADLLSKISKLGIAVLTRRGFTIGIGDFDLLEETKEEINAAIRKAEEEALKLIDEFYAGKLHALPGRTVAETLELRILEALNRARNKSGDIAVRQVRESSALTMSDAVREEIP